MPRLRATDFVAERARAMRRSGDRLDHGCVTALFGGERLCVGLAEILAAIVELRGGDGWQHEARTEATRERAQHACAQRRRERHVGHARGGQLVTPETRMPRFGFRKLQEDVAPVRVALGGGERVVQRSAVELVDEIGAKSLDVVHGFHGVVSRL